MIEVQSRFPESAIPEVLLHSWRTFLLARRQDWRTKKQEQGDYVPIATATIATALAVRDEPYDAGIIGKTLSHIIPVQMLHPNHYLRSPLPLVYSREFISCQGRNIEACVAKFAPKTKGPIAMMEVFQQNYPLRQWTPGAKVEQIYPLATLMTLPVSSQP